MIDLLETTFIIPVKIDSLDRLNNLEIVLNYLNSNFDTTIIIYEVYNSKPNIPKVMLEYCYYLSEKSTTPYFHRTKILNKLSEYVNTDITCIYDSDVILPISSYKLAEDLIIKDNFDVVYPYGSNLFVDIHKYEINKFVENNMNPHSIQLSIRGGMYYTCVGGAIFVNTDFYVQCGLENENFKSWGGEDEERDFRFNFLGKITRIDDYLFHLNHFRGRDSIMENDYYMNNKKELEKVKDMDKQCLFEYISKGFEI